MMNNQVSIEIKMHSSRKGVKSVVLERSETLRETGAAVGVYANCWYALYKLAVASTLRSTAIPFECEVEAHCLKRIDLIEALVNELPSGTIRFGCQVLCVDVETSSSNPVVQLHNGSIIKAKVLIGCDEANSIVANFIGLKPTQPFSRSAVRGLTIYPNGHGFAPVFLRIRKDVQLVGRIPIDEKTVYWFIVLCENIRGKAAPVNLCLNSLTFSSSVSNAIGFLKGPT